VFLDEAFPIDGTSHADARRYIVKDGALLVDDMPLVQPAKFVGYKGNPKAPDAILLKNNGLHVELVFDRAHFIGSRDQALLADVQIESAMSAIMDCEDSVACVDAADKVQAYANWLGLMRGDLSETFLKGGKPLERRLNPDRSYTAPDGSPLTIADLPPMNMRRWVIRRKAEVVAAVNGGLLTIEEVCDRYQLTLEEFASWQRAVDRSGMQGLRVTRIQHYRDLYERQLKY
jgi:hypothetical protein